GRRYRGRAAPGCRLGLRRPRPAGGRGGPDPPSRPLAGRARRPPPPPRPRRGLAGPAGRRPGPGPGRLHPRGPGRPRVPRRRRAPRTTGSARSVRRRGSLRATANSSLLRPSYRVKGYLTATARRSEMWVDTGAEVRARMGELVGDAERKRLGGGGGGGRGGGGRTLTGYVQQVRQAAGFSLVRTGLRLLDAGRV